MNEAPAWHPITLPEIAEVVGAITCFELGLVCGHSPGAAALVATMEGNDLQMKQLDGALDVLSWEVAAHFESLVRGWKRKGGWAA